MSWRSLIVAAVAHAPEFFSPAFLSELECSSPFRFSFLQARNRKLTSRKSLYTAVFNALVEEPETKELPIAGLTLSPAALQN